MGAERGGVMGARRGGMLKVEAKRWRRIESQGRENRCKERWRGGREKGRG